LKDASQGERHDDFVVPQTPAALHEPQIPYQAVMTVAHSGETGIVSESHHRTMHWRAILSNLDASRISGHGAPWSNFSSMASSFETALRASSG
jgi:hypothetical protein